MNQRWDYRNPRFVLLEKDYTPEENTLRIEKIDELRDVLSSYEIV